MQYFDHFTEQRGCTTPAAAFFSSFFFTTAVGSDEGIGQPQGGQV